MLPLSNAYLRFTAITFATLALLVATHTAQAQVPTPSNDPVVFDDISTGTFRFTNATPRSFIGAKINLAGLPTPDALTLTQMQLGLAHISPTAVQYTDIQLQVKFYDDGSLTGDVFTDPASSVLTFDVFDAIKAAGTVTNDTLAANNAYFFRVNLPDTLKLKDPYNVGIAFHFLGDKGDGQGLQASDALSLVLRSGSAYSVGSSDFNDPNAGYLRDGGDGNPPRNDFNFDQSDGKSISSGGVVQPNAGVALKLYGVAVVPEAGTGILTILAGLVSGTVLVVRRRRPSVG